MTGSASPLAVFNHIPKAAGTTVTAVLQAALKPRSFSYRVDQSLMGGYVELDKWSPVARRQVVREPLELPFAEFVTGHMAPGTTRARFPHARHITVLRDQRTRVISQWVHSRSVAELDLRRWGLAREFRVAHGSLRDYLNAPMMAPNVDNTITRFLTWPHPTLSQTAFIAESDDAELLEQALLSVARFHHANVVENPDFLAQLGESLGVQIQPGRRNDRSDFPPMIATDLAAELDNETRELLDHRSRIDRLVWEQVARAVMPERSTDEILQRGLDGSISRYSALPVGKVRGGVTRRAAETVLRAKVRLDPRLREFS